MSIQDQVIADLEARKQIGLKSYGTLLQPHNGRDMLQDLYEELLDACCYVKGAMIERDADVPVPVEADPELLSPDIRSMAFFRKRFQ